MFLSYPHGQFVRDCPSLGTSQASSRAGSPQCFIWSSGLSEQPGATWAALGPLKEDRSSDKNPVQA